MLTSDAQEAKNFFQVWSLLLSGKYGKWRQNLNFVSKPLANIMETNFKPIVANAIVQLNSAQKVTVSEALYVS